MGLWPAGKKRRTHVSPIYDKAILRYEKEKRI